MSIINLSNKKIKIDKDLSIAEILRHCRVKNKIDTNDVASFLRVKKQDILDLENGIIHKNKPPLYVNGLIRSYANLLKIDSQLVKEKLQSSPQEIDQEAAQAQKHKLIDREKNSKYTPNRKYLTYSLVLLLASYCLLFYDFNTHQNLDNIITKLKNLK